MQEMFEVFQAEGRAVQGAMPLVRILREHETTVSIIREGKTMPSAGFFGIFSLSVVKQYTTACLNRKIIGVIITCDNFFIKRCIHGVSSKMIVRLEQGLKEQENSK
jgi:hypothetical protein